jgi:PAS domain S-box-containing protein
MTTYNQLTFHDLDEDAVVRAILEGTATETGARFFAALVENLSMALNTHSAWVTEYIEKSRQLRALAFWADGEMITDFVIDIDGTPCEAVIDNARLVHYPDNILEFFPRNSSLKKYQAVSYMGVPLLDSKGRILGNLAVMDTRPMPEELHSLAIFKIFAARASAELQRIRAEQEIQMREEKYRRIVETAGEGFLLMDQNFIINDVNAAFCKLCGFSRSEIIGKAPFDFLNQNFKAYFLPDGRKNSGEHYRRFEDTVVSKDGRHIPIFVHGSTLRDDRGSVIGNMAFITDMTEHKKSLALAGEIQNSLLPRTSPQIPGLDIAAKNISCDEIGGDYFDFLSDLPCANSHFDVVVGDVTGHGVDAALLMTTARAFLRMRASQCGLISQIITEMNRHFTLDILDTGRFMTLFYMSIDPENRNLQWIRAGHDPAILYKPDEDIFEELKGEGLALGVDEKFLYEENLKTGLAPGQIIAIGTDGIWETFNQQGEMFGKHRFREIIREHAHLSAKEILSAVYEALDAFTAGLKKDDDVTLVVIKMCAPPMTGENWQI